MVPTWYPAQCGIGVFLFSASSRPTRPFSSAPAPFAHKFPSRKGLIARSPDTLSLLPCLLPKTLPLQRTSTICAYLHIGPRTWVDIIHTPALVPPRVKSSWCVFSFQTTPLWSTDGLLSPIQSAAESEPPEENSTAENGNTVCDLSGPDSRLFTTR
jgi:hypothetical protein